MGGAAALLPTVSKPAPRAFSKPDDALLPSHTHLLPFVAGMAPLWPPPPALPCMAAMHLYGQAWVSCFLRHRSGTPLCPVMAHVVMAKCEESNSLMSHRRFPVMNIDTTP